MKYIPYRFHFHKNVKIVQRLNQVYLFIYFFSHKEANFDFNRLQNLLMAEDY